MEIQDFNPISTVKKHILAGKKALTCNSYGFYLIPKKENGNTFPPLIASAFFYNDHLK